MKISYQYKIKPTKEQATKIDNTLNMLRHQYNFMLAQRFNWYEQNRCSIDRCPISICQLPELTEQPNYYNQKASLTQLKKERPWYKEIHSQVLQEVPKRVEKAFDRWLKGDFNGKKSGKKAAYAKSQNRRLVNEILRHGNKIKTEKVSIKGWQKIYGKAISAKSPGFFQSELARKAESAGGQFIQFSTQKSALSQTHLDGTRILKLLSERVHYDVTVEPLPALKRRGFRHYLLTCSPSDLSG